MGTQENSPKGWVNSLRSLVLLFLSAPAAIGLLSKVDDRLEIGGLLERIVINYERVSEAAWSYVFDFLAIDLGLDHLFLSFILLTTIPSLFYFLYFLATKPSHSKDEFWFNAGLASFLVIAGQMVPIYFGVAFLAITPVIIFPIYVIRNIESYTVSGRISDLLEGSIGMIFVLLFSFAYLFHVIFVTQTWYEILYALAIIPCCLLVLFSMWIGYKGMVHIVVIAAGVFFFNWLATVGLPSTSAWLTAIGA